MNDEIIEVEILMEKMGAEFDFDSACSYGIEYINSIEWHEE